MRMYPPAVAAILCHPYVRRRDKDPLIPSLKPKDDVEIAISGLDYCQD